MIAKQQLAQTLGVIFEILGTLLQGAWRLIRLAAIGLLEQFNKLNKFERIFTLFLLISGLLLLGGWLGYTIAFEDKKVITHKIMTDDFFWYFIFHLIASLPVLQQLAYPVCSSAEFRLAFSLRIIGLLGISVLYLLTLANPQRVSPTHEATFTWNFYAFGVVHLAAWASGLKGMVLYAQKSHSD